MSPNISKCSRNLPRSQTHHSFHLVVAKKNKATNYTTNLRTSKAFTFHRKNPSRKTAQGQCWEWSLWAGEAGDLPGTSGEFVTSLSSFRRGDCWSFTPPKKTTRGLGYYWGKKRVRGKMVSRCQRLQRRVFGCFWFRGKPQLLSLKRVDCLMIFITLFKIYIRYDFVSHHCHIVLLLDTIWYNSFQFSIICLLHVRKQHAQIRATFNWRVSTGQPASAFAEKNTFATCSHLCKDSKNQTYILKTY